MKKFHFFLVLPALFMLLNSCSTTHENKIAVIDHLPYPTTNKVDTTDDYFGTKIADPYRWLENDTTAETGAWVDEQNKVTFDYLEKIPFRQQLKERLTQVWNYEKFGTPFKKGKYYFFYKNDGLQNQNVLYVQEGLSGTPKILIDPNTLSSDGTTALSGISIREDGKYIAYNLAKSGSDWTDLVVTEIENGQTLSDTIHWVKFSQASWQGDGFYYSTYPAPTSHAYSGKNENSKAYYHKLGTQQSEDKIMYSDAKHPGRGWNIGVTDDGKFMGLWGSQSTSGNSFAIKDANAKNWTWVDTSFNNEYNLIDNINGQLLVQTNNNAPKWQVVLIDPAKPQPENWKKIIPESNDLLEGVELCNGKIVAKYLHDVTNKLVVYNINGTQEKEVPTPPLGVVAFSASMKDSIAFYSFTNYTTPTSIYKYNINSNTSEVYFKPSVDFVSDNYESKQVFYPSKDGTKIPMIITYKKGIELNGNNPCFLYGYGGFNINITPSFINSSVAFLENGGVYAVANMRGGNEYGEEWHKGGIKCNKQNVFDDFIAGAEYLIKEKYTSSQKLAIHGRSNGGLLVGAVMTQRPDLMKVALPGVGVLDMLRYHKFTIGYYWAGDYGKSDNKEEFDCLVKYSPLHNVKEVEYPATMITTADHDDRVVPAHSFKFAATLQEKHKGSNPILVRIDKKAGHGAGKPTTKQIEEWADIWSFVFYNLGMTPQNAAAPKG
ncbi:MAG TPA: prolyl oligopeptidase family serine peptidase [Bacteroidia bacterium]|nr:prolyl oligopeptidase family serine peptidase [Bacteroidia bacterium]